MLLILLCLIPLDLLANIYHPHVTVKAKTLTPKTFALESTPGGSINNSFIISSLSLGLTDRLQVGSVPTMYLAKNAQYNFNFKYHLYRSEQFNSSIGLSRFKFTLENYQEQIDFFINFISLSFNYTPSELAYSLGFTFNQATAYARGYWQSYQANSEWMVDLILNDLFNDYYLSFGVGRHQIDFAPNRDNSTQALGASLTSKAKLYRIKNARLGMHYLMHAGGALLLASGEF
jgi:hypothetical protein